MSYDPHEIVSPVEITEDGVTSGWTRGQLASATLRALSVCLLRELAPGDYQAYRILKRPPDGTGAATTVTRMAAHIYALDRAGELAVEWAREAQQ